MTRFGTLVRQLRRQKGLTLEHVARKIGTHKGYISGIENGKVNPPSVSLVRKFAKLFGRDERHMVLVAWIDKAPKIIKPDLEGLLVPKAEPPQASPTP